MRASTVVTVSFGVFLVAALPNYEARSGGAVADRPDTMTCFPHGMANPAPMPRCRFDVEPGRKNRVQALSEPHLSSTLLHFAPIRGLTGGPNDQNNHQNHRA